jgi:alpha-galactosidase
MTSKLRLSIALLGLAAWLPCQAGIYTFSDFTRPANAASLTETFDFVPNEGWSGTPPNAISGEPSVYLKVTVSWAAAANIGTFQARFNRNDDAGAARWGMGTDGSGFGFMTANATGDPDGAGPATAKPAVVSYDKTANTSVTLVLKVNQVKALTSPGGDWWFGDTVTANAQDGACGFMWINPNLAAPEASQPTPWAAWRSSNDSYSGVSFISDTAEVDLVFSNIAIYTGDDTPFATTGGGVDAATSTVSASPTAVPADGTTTSTITVTLKDAGNSPVAGKEVSLSGNGSANIATGNNISNASGVVTFTVKSNDVGVEQFTATDVTDGNLVITQTASVDFQTPVVVGPVNAGNSTVVASPATVVANGIATSTVTVTLKDSNGLLIVGEGVTLSGNPSGASISPAGAQTSNASGQAVFTVKSTTIGSVVFTATSVTDNVTLSQTANVEFTDPVLAQAFNVNFLDDGQANATGLVGVVGNPGETWNQGTGYNTGALSNLVDTTGSVVSAVGVSGLGDDGRVIGAGAQGVFTGNRGFFGKGQDTTIQITGLTPNTAYDIHIYALSHSTTSWGNIADTERAAGDFVTTHTVLGNGQSQWLDNGKAGTNGNTFVPNGNYVTFQSIVSNGSGNISIVVDAYDGIDGLANTNDGNCRLHVCGLQIRPASGMSVDYMNWRNASYPGLGLPDEDDDGDGLSNEYERIFGLDPMSAASASPYTAPFNSETGFFGYSRRTQSLGNLNYKVWYSTDLEEWFEDNAASQLPDSTANDVEIMGVRIDPKLLGEAKLFVQVRATPITGIDPEPSLLNIRGSGNTITLIFSEPMNPSSAANPNNYSVVQDGVGALTITGATLNPGGGSVTLTLASTLGIDTAYTVSLDGVTSGTGQSLAGIDRAFRTWDDDPNGVKVFILAGQSNMVGRGESERGHNDVPGAIGSLRWEVVTDNANYGQLVVNSGNPATDPWAVRSDVKVWWNRADIGGTANVSKGGLKPGFGSGAATFGPEYGFGWVVGDSISQPVLVIKTAWGGKDLVTNFRPPGAVAARGGVVGGYYIELLEQVREVLHHLGTEFPEWNGLGYEIAGFGWHQGWNDSLSTIAANEYEANMANFITDIRAEFGKASLPFSIGTTGMDGTDPNPIPVDRVKVVNAQINVANPALHPELGGNVFTVDTRPFAETTENSPTNDTTHWKNNGKSMYRIGKGMGDGMVDLLAP